MITEDYVSFETAKLLKEKGFKIPYDSFRGVYINGIFKRLNPGDAYGYNLGDEIVEVCSLQMAMKWLREVYKLSIEPYYDVVLAWVVDIKHIGKHTDTREFETVRENCYKTYEEACEVAIKYCLENLI